MNRKARSTFGHGLKFSKMDRNEFGKMIYETRIYQGMTQKELAESCSVDIRTIQRIESGDVMPRLYTIKLLSGVLGFPLDELNVNPNAAQNENLTLTLAFVFGVIFIVNYIPQIFFESRLSASADDRVLFSVWLGLSVIHVVSVIFFFKGWHQIGKIYQLSLLKIASLLTIVLVPVYIISFAVSNYTSFPLSINLKNATILMSGISALIFGFGLIKLKIKANILAEIAGIFQILCGILFLLPLDLTHFFGLLLSFPGDILLLIIIYREKNRAVN